MFSTLLSIGLCIVTDVPPTEATFRFAPPDGLHLVQRLKETTHDRVGPLAPVIETRETVSDVQWRRSADGYVMTVTLRKTRYTLDGKTYADSKARVLINHPINYRVSEDGKLLAVEGYDSAMESIKHIPAELQQKVAGEMRPQRLSMQDTAEWYRRFARFVGKTVRVGDEWEVTDHAEEALGGLRINALTRFPEMRQDGERLLVVIDYQYATTDSIRDGGSPNRNTPVPILKAKGQLVVDASTLVIVSEKVTTVVAAQVSEFENGSPVNRVFTSTREYSYEPAPPVAAPTPAPGGSN